MWPLFLLPILHPTVKIEQGYAFASYCAEQKRGKKRSPLRKPEHKYTVTPFFRVFIDWVENVMLASKAE